MGNRYFYKESEQLWSYWVKNDETGNRWYLQRDLKTSASSNCEVYDVLELGFKEIPDPTQPRFFRYKNQKRVGNAIFWMVKPDGKITCHFARDRGVSMDFGIDKLQVPNCEEFSANSLEEALDIQFPESLAAGLDTVVPIPVVVKPGRKERYFHFSTSGPGDALLYILHANGTVSFVDSDGEEDESMLNEAECNLRVQTGYFTEFHRKSKESAIRSRMIAMVYMEGKAAGEKAGYDRAKRELLSKLQAA